MADLISVYFGNFLDGKTASFNLDLGGLYSVNGIIASVDNNDDYTFSFYNGNTLEETYTYPAGAGNVQVSPGGDQNFNTHTAYGSPPSFTPVNATNVVVSALNGDAEYGIGEVEFSGTAAAVPEPSTWVMMLLGFGLVGCWLRKRSSMYETVRCA